MFNPDSAISRPLSTCLHADRSRVFSLTRGAETLRLENAIDGDGVPQLTLNILTREAV
jgi:hypothetical protein